MTSPRALLARAEVLADCIDVRLVSLDLRFPEDGDIAAIKRKLAELAGIVRTLGGKP